MTALSRRLASSALAGAASGARSLTGLAALTLATRPGAVSQPDQVLSRRWVKVIAGVLAAQEYALDKLPVTPSRLDPPGLAGRLAGSAGSGIVIARREPGAVVTPVQTASCAVTSLGTAVVTAWLGVRWRAWASDRLGHDWIGAIMEDAVALTLAASAAALTADQEGAPASDAPPAGG